MPTLVVVALPVEACEGVREEVMKAKEQAILKLGKTLAKNNAPEGKKSPHFVARVVFCVEFRARSTD